MAKLSRFALETIKQRDGEEAQGLAEYSLILALIALVCITALSFLGTSISAFFNHVAGILP
jgi:Flp pilus assembly pilin Flp